MRPTIAILLVSGFTGEVAPPKQVGGRPIHFLGKPFDAAKLTRAVRVESARGAMV
jgi:hypothetical protein